MSSELLTPEERALKPLNICGCEQVNDDSDRCRGCYRTALHYESVIIPARIAEVKKHYDDLADQYEEVVLPKIVAEERAKWIKEIDELCTDDSHSGGYWEGDGFDDKGNFKKGAFHYDRKCNCDECWQSIKELGR